VLFTNYYSDDKIEKNEIDGACNAYGWRRVAQRFLVGKPKRRRPLGRPRHRWEDVRMDLQDVGCGDMDWIDLAQDSDR
jgi:hypothetical protein